MDTRGIDMQPLPFSNWAAAAYFVTFVFLFAFFTVNIFVGVLIDFMKNQDGSALLTEAQQKLMDLQKFQVNTAHLCSSKATSISPNLTIRTNLLRILSEAAQTDEGRDLSAECAAPLALWFGRITILGTLVQCHPHLQCGSDALRIRGDDAGVVRHAWPPQRRLFEFLHPRHGFQTDRVLPHSLLGVTPCLSSDHCTYRRTYQ
jgi:hypothetical protein